MGTKVVRVPDDTATEAAAASRILGRSAGDLLAEAWRAYRESEDFKQTFAIAQKAFAAGDLSFIAHHLEDANRVRAADRAARVRAMRSE